MKKIVKVFVSVFILGIALSSCGDDGEDEIEKVYFEVAETEYPLSQAYVAKNGETNNVYFRDLILFSQGFVITELQDGYVDVTGTGNGILFSMYSSNADKLSVGTYQYDNASSENAGTFDDASYILNYDAGGDTGDEIGIVSGTITVIQNTPEYKIIFDCTDETGKRVKGAYKGNLPHYFGS